MPCKPCSHRDRILVDQQLIDGQPIRAISARTGLSVGSLHRHKSHIRIELGRAAQAREASDSERGSELLIRVNDVIRTAQELLVAAKADKSYTAAVAALNTIVRALEVIGKVDGSIPQSTQGGVHLTLSKTTNVNVRMDGDEEELAALVSEATNSWDPATVERLKRIAEKASLPDAACNSHATVEINPPSSTS